jgi:hypothetical protein
MSRVALDNTPYNQPLNTDGMYCSSIVRQRQTTSRMSPQLHVNDQAQPIKRKSNEDNRCSTKRSPIENLVNISE